MDWSLLNSEQIAAAKHTEGAVIVSAGAGSGKTRLLTQRIAHIIEKGVSPYNILAITFTNKAATVMRERIESITGDAKYMWVMTFHGMCARILRSNIDRLGYNSNFTIYGDAEKERIIKQLLQDRNEDKDKWLKKIKERISAAKSSAEDPDIYLDECYDDNSELIKAVYHEYNAQLMRNNALDFDDLLLITYQLLRDNDDIRAKYRERFKYVSVDEFQDTNNLQFELICQLVAPDGNIFVVGDENQSIYGWRYANIGNMKNFIKRFGATYYKLEQNYRSTQKILDAANKVISYNDSLSDKKLWTENKGGVKIERFFAYDERAEAEYVAERIKALKEYSSTGFGEVALLLRVNALTRAFEEAFLSYGIPYRVFGGMKFYERKEVKDLLAYLRLISNPKDNEALIRIINFPKRGIGNATVAALIEEADRLGISAMEVLAKSGEYLNSFSGLKKLVAFYAVMTDIAEYTASHSLTDAVNYIIEATGTKQAYSSGDEEDFNRLMNLDQFANSVNEFCENNTDSSLETFLQSVSLISDLDNMEEDGGYVNLATIHSAKGMEFDVVFISGLEEGLFPISRAKESKDDLEEERRLMYVAITRARKRLYMTCANSRFMYGKRAYNPKSRFLAESNTEEPQPAVGNVFASGSVGSGAGLSNSLSSTGVGARFEPKTETDPRLSTVGTQVSHKIFGKGVITEAVNADNNTMVKVNFVSVGVKSLMLSFAPLEVVE